MSNKGGEEENDYKGKAAKAQGPFEEIRSVNVPKGRIKNAVERKRDRE